jgi:hypothetical protein
MSSVQRPRRLGAAGAALCAMLLAAAGLTSGIAASVQYAADANGSASRPLGDGPIATYQLLVFSNPLAGQDASYEDWYDHQHVPDVLMIPGFQYARRFAATDAEQGKDLQLPQYLALFTLKSGGLQATNDEITARGRDGRTRPSASFDVKTGVVAFAIEGAQASP